MDARSLHKSLRQGASIVLGLSDLAAPLNPQHFGLSALRMQEVCVNPLPFALAAPLHGLRDAGVTAELIAARATVLCTWYLAAAQTAEPDIISCSPIVAREVVRWAADLERSQLSSVSKSPAAVNTVFPRQTEQRSRTSRVSSRPWEAATFCCSRAGCVRCGCSARLCFVKPGVAAAPPPIQLRGAGSCFGPWAGGGASTRRGGGAGNANTGVSSGARRAGSGPGQPRACNRARGQSRVRDTFASRHVGCFWHHSCCCRS